MSSNLKILTRSLPERTTPAPSIALLHPPALVACLSDQNSVTLFVVWVWRKRAVQPAIVHSNVYELLYCANEV